ncbi:bifunctional N-acetylglucosamine-1-phosphate uridyltransferase [Neokomagataea thailandica NBRC 106555]|nr:bifunctional N-acetylglucosamine-1-phosphate uridyltransferase [Neokomagataea thailandica NBRC 106555]
MKSRLPKALHRLANRPMINHLIDTVQQVADDIVVVVGPDMPALEKAAHPHRSVVQTERLGTGHAARTAEPFFGEGDVIILNADNPLISSETLHNLLSARKNGAALAMLGMRPKDPARYGRVVEANGNVQRIVEYKDATDEERGIGLCNAGAFCASAQDLRVWLSQIDNKNAQNEYYLTDVVALAAQSRTVQCVVADEAELAGVNSRAELAQVEHSIQQRLRAAAMANGATLVAPETVFFSADTVIETDVTIEPNVFFGPGVTVRSDSIIRAFSHLENCTIGEAVSIGPYARIRPGTICEKGSHVGNFVELKNVTLGAGAKANHLTYLGDASIGAATNIGAGTITCNYDGVFKHRTTIGANGFIGSNAILVAPVNIGDEALIAAGSVITANVSDGAMAFGRARQTEKTERGRETMTALRKKKEQG